MIERDEVRRKRREEEAEESYTALVNDFEKQRGECGGEVASPHISDEIER